MIEPEMAFKDLYDGIKLADKLLKFVISNVMEKHPEEFDFLEKFINSDIKIRLKNFNFLN